MTRSVNIVQVEYVAYRLAKATLSWTEPIPPFETRYPEVLEKCLTLPFQKYQGKDLYKGLIKKSAVMFYLMIKDHPFQNGNKRIAMTTLFYLLHRNNKWMKVDNQELYNFAKWVAESNAKLKDETVSAIEKFIETYIVDL